MNIAEHYCLEDDKESFKTIDLFKPISMLNVDRKKILESTCDKNKGIFDLSSRHLQTSAKKKWICRKHYNKNEDKLRLIFLIFSQNARPKCHSKQNVNE